MMNRKSNFTLIELIVVIVVLGILAAIVIPNISSFQKEAREAQLTADARNIQTALDMYRAKSESGSAEPILLGSDSAAVTFTAADEDGATQTLFAVDMEELAPKFLRKPPKYVQNGKVFEGVAGGDQTDLLTADSVNASKGQVVVGILGDYDADGNGTVEAGETTLASTAVVQFVTHDGAVKIVR